MNKVGIIDYGVSNILSVRNALNFLRYHHVCSDNPNELSDCDALVLPGVGAFAHGMKNLKELGFADFIRHRVGEDEIPILGICLGMQMLAEDSEEKGFHEGLGLVPGNIRSIPAKNEYSNPHVGWNRVFTQNVPPIYGSGNDYFYFDHSYHFECEVQYISGTFNYPSEMTASVCHNHIAGTQFHPEKSGKAGLILLRKFMEANKIKTIDGQLARYA